MNVEDFSLTIGEDKVPWRLFTPKQAGKEYIVLWLQGWSSSMDSHREGVEKMSTQSGMAFATLDFAGHGLHKLPIDESTRQQQLDETIAIYDELKKRGYNKVIVVGGSFGGYLAAMITGKRKVHTVVLRAPAMYADDELETPYKDTRKWNNPLRDQKDKTADEYIKDNLAGRSISEFDGFTYVLEHELDEVVPQIMPRTYFKNAKYGNYLIVPKTMHSPKVMPNPRPHFDYIEHWIISILDSVKLAANLTD